jgi:hypothetical protein
MISKQNQHLAIISLTLLLTIALGFWTNQINKQTISPSSSALPTNTLAMPDPNHHYQIIYRENPNNPTLTDIYLKRTDTGAELFFITLANIGGSIRTNTSEYHQGNLYVSKIIGYNARYPDQPWTEELWRYDSSRNGTKLYYTEKGFSYRVRPDEQLIAIITNENLKLLNHEGKTITTIDSTNLRANPELRLWFNFRKWGINSIWLDNAFNADILGLVKLDTTTYKIKQYSLLGLPTGPEFDLDIYSEKIAFSNYPALFDIDSRQEYLSSGAQVNLVVYDLNTKVMQKIATSITKEFKPKWVAPNTLEYTSPTDDSRITVVVN